MIFVVDASVAVKWYTLEADSDQAAALLVGDHLLIAPAHAFGEIGEVLSRRVRDGRIARGQFEAALNGARRTLMIAPIDELLSDAAEIALDGRVSYYDALYVAAAVRWAAPLVTTDEKLLRALSGTMWSANILRLSRVGSVA